MPVVEIIVILIAFLAFMVQSHKYIGVRKDFVRQRDILLSKLSLSTSQLHSYLSVGITTVGSGRGLRYKSMETNRFIKRSEAESVREEAAALTRIAYNDNLNAREDFYKRATFKYIYFAISMIGIIAVACYMASIGYPDA